MLKKRKAFGDITTCKLQVTAQQSIGKLDNEFFCERLSYVAIKCP